jgi:cardiolipin synthase A/B
MLEIALGMMDTARESALDVDQAMSSPSTATGIPFVESGSYPVRSGNAIRPLIDGMRAFQRIGDAVEAAERSVWVTVAFMWPAFEMPGGRGSALDVLDRAAARGVDVRIIFWRPDDETEGYRRNAFWGSVEHIALLERRRSGVKVRWDRAHPGFCQHQKSWLIDAGAPRETSFVGGMNLNPHSVCVSGHRGDGQNHDVYVELRGPSVVDVHHNFVQRWNEASERRAAAGRWGAGSDTELPFPTRLPSEEGNVLVQVQRTVHGGRYVIGHPAPSGVTFDIASGERSNADQYCAAIDAARHSIFIENQYFDVLEIVNRLHAALRRGVEVVVVVPAEPDGASTMAERATLGSYGNFTLAGLAGLGDDGRRKPVYVHDKVMLVDDEWATIGSCNLHRFSLYGNGELNVAFHGSSTVRSFRTELLMEHLDRDTSDMDDRSALRLFRAIALENRKRLDANDGAWQGIAFALDANSYARRDGRRAAHTSHSPTEIAATQKVVTDGPSYRDTLL